MPTRCPGCGLERAAHDGPTHPYLVASPACWALYGEVLAREFEDPRRFAVHQLTVDAYGVTHPGGTDPRAVRSVALHLMTLCAVFEDGADASRGPALHRRIAAAPPFATRLEPPPLADRTTVLHVHGADGPEDHVERVWEWARDAWDAWRPHHPIVRRWLGGLD